MRLSRGAALALPLLLACGDSPVGPGGDGGLDIFDGQVGDGGRIEGLESLSIEPPDVTFRIDGTTPASQTFRVLGRFAGGRTQDVTAAAAFRLTDSSLGQMNGARFTSALVGGRTTLVAELGGKSTNASINVIIERVIIVAPGPGQDVIPPNVPSDIKGAPVDPRRAPSLVYPNDGVLIPPNLNGLEIHYRRHDSSTIFEISFESVTSSVSFFTRCQTLGEGCVFEPPEADWASLRETYRGTGPVRVRIRATDEDQSYQSRSNSIQIELSAKPVQGGLYYWSTSLQSIMRVDFNASQQVPEKFFPFTGDGCYGCHSLSPNGRRMTVSRAGQNQAQLTLIDVGSRTTVFRDDGDRREQFQSWDPTSQMFAAIYGDNNAPGDYVRTAIRIRDGNSGDVLQSIDVGDEPTHPDWSPAGDRIVFTRSTMPDTTNQRPGRAGISYIRRAGPGNWEGPFALIEPADGFNRYYPAYSPDARFMVYNESICEQGQTYNGACDGDADDVAKLWAMQADGTGARIPLEKANAPGLEDDGNRDLANTFPKWAPFVDPRTRDGQGKVMWMTFSSRRQYGLRSPAGSGQLLWMVGIDPERIVAGNDGSHAAFALPFQDLSTSNHIAQWAAVIVPPVSTGDGGVPGGDGGGPGGDGGLDPGGETDGGQCGAVGDPCSPSNNTCCAGTICADQGGGVFRCRFDF